MHLMNLIIQEKLRPKMSTTVLKNVENLIQKAELEVCIENEKREKIVIEKTKKMLVSPPF